MTPNLVRVGDPVEKRVMTFTDTGPILEWIPGTCCVAEDPRTHAIGIAWPGNREMTGPQNWRRACAIKAEREEK